MGSDDDTIIIRGKIKQAITAPVTVKRWHLAVLAIAAFLVGLACG